MTETKQTTPPPEPDIMDVIARAALNPDTDRGIMMELRSLRRELNNESEKRQFFAAMSRVQAEISQIATDAGNPQTNSRYATLAALDRAIRPHYTKEGFSIGFDDELTDRGLRVQCTVSRGGWQTTHHHTVAISTHGIKGTQMMTETHAGASALSYGKRYTLAMAFNIAVERDDDGNAAGGRPISNSELDELMAIVHERGLDTTQILQPMSERLGYPVENLSQVMRKDMNRVRSWLSRSKGRSQ